MSRASGPSSRRHPGAVAGARPEGPAAPVRAARTPPEIVRGIAGKRLTVDQAARLLPSFRPVALWSELPRLHALELLALHTPADAAELHPLPSVEEREALFEPRFGQRLADHGAPPGDSPHAMTQRLTSLTLTSAQLRALLPPAGRMSGSSSCSTSGREGAAVRLRRF